jgi:hypothetical protein
MQGPTRTERELLDAQAMVGELVPAGGVFASGCRWLGCGVPGQGEQPEPQLLIGEPRRLIA